MSLEVEDVEAYQTITLGTVIRGEACDKTKLPVRILNIRRSDKGNRLSVFTYKRGSNKASQVSAEYDRMILCGDLTSHLCAVIFCRTAADTKALLSDALFKVGDTVVLPEPRFLNQYLDEGRMTPVLRVKHTIHRFTPSSPLPAIPLQVQMPSYSGFYLPNIRLNFSSFRILSACGGTLCNRLPLSQGPGNCGCVTKPALPGLVLEGDIDVVTGNDEGEIETYLNGSIGTGLSFSAIFLDEYCLRAHSWQHFKLRDIKQCCSSILSHIVGWNIGGWSKPAVETDDYSITEVRQFHIVHLSPIYKDANHENEAHEELYHPPLVPPVDGHVEGRPSALYGRDAQQDEMDIPADSDNDNINEEHVASKI